MCVKKTRRKSPQIQQSPGSPAARAAKAKKRAGQTANHAERKAHEAGHRKIFRVWAMVRRTYEPHLALSVPGDADEKELSEFTQLLIEEMDDEEIGRYDSGDREDWIHEKEFADFTEKSPVDFTVERDAQGKLRHV